MNKKFLNGMSIVIGMSLSFSAFALQPQVLGTKQTFGAMGLGTEQDVTVMTDGTINTVFKDKGIVTTSQITIQGDNVVVVKRDPFSVSTTVMDMKRTQEFMQSHPEVVQGTTDFLAMLAKFSPTKDGNITNNGAPCAIEATNMINAGYAMGVACASGNPYSCMTATGEYTNAVNAHNTCMNTRFPPGGGN